MLLTRYNVLSGSFNYQKFFGIGKKHVESYIAPSGAGAYVAKAYC